MGVLKEDQLLHILRIPKINPKLTTENLIKQEFYSVHANQLSANKNRLDSVDTSPIALFISSKAFYVIRSSVCDACTNTQFIVLILGVRFTNCVRPFRAICGQTNWRWRPINPVCGWQPVNGCPDLWTAYTW